jgi:hypothetical protein
LKVDDGDYYYDYDDDEDDDGGGSSDFDGGGDGGVRGRMKLFYSYYYRIQKSKTLCQSEG